MQSSGARPCAELRCTAAVCGPGTRLPYSAPVPGWPAPRSRCPAAAVGGSRGGRREVGSRRRDPPGSARVLRDRGVCVGCGVTGDPARLDRGDRSGASTGRYPAVTALPGSALLFQGRMRRGGGFLPPPLSPHRPPPPVPPARPGSAPLPARRSAAGARGERQLRVAAATGECQPGGGRRSHCFSLNFMASVHYYTVRIFIWTAKLKTDFCQNCRYHKKRRLPALGSRRAAEAAPLPPPDRAAPLRGLPGGRWRGVRCREVGGLSPRFCATGKPGRRPGGGCACESPRPPEPRPGRAGLAAVPAAPGAAEPPPPPPGLPGSIAEELKQGHLCLESLRSSKPANACWHRPPANAGTPECGTACSPPRGPRPGPPLPPAVGPSPARPRWLWGEGVLGPGGQGGQLLPSPGTRVWTVWGDGVHPPGQCPDLGVYMELHMSPSCPHQPRYRGFRTPLALAGVDLPPVYPLSHCQCGDKP